MAPVKGGKRDEDREAWTWLNYYLTKYKILFWIIGWFLIAAGFGFKTPAQATHRLQEQIDTLQHQTDTLYNRQNEIRRTMRDLKFLACLNHQEQSICQPSSGTH